MRTNIENPQITDPIIGRGLRTGVEVQALGGNITLTNAFPPLLSLDPGGAGRDVTLPAVERGLIFFIINTADAAEDLTVKNAGGSTIITVSQSESGIVWSDGVIWGGGVLKAT